MMTTETALRLEVLEMRERLERLEGKRGPQHVGPDVHLVTPAPFDASMSIATHPTSDLLGKLHLVPFYVDGNFGMRRFLAWVSSNSGASIIFIAALYRLINASATRQDFNRVSGSSDGAAALGMSSVMRPGLRAELVERFDFFATTSGTPVEYRHDLKRNRTLPPGAYAIGYTVNSVDGLWHYGPVASIRCGYRGEHDTDAVHVAVKGLSAPAPYFVLRSDQGVRMYPFNDEVDSGW